MFFLPSVVLNGAFSVVDSMPHVKLLNLSTPLPLLMWSVSLDRGFEHPDRIP